MAVNVFSVPTKSTYLHSRDTRYDTTQRKNVSKIVANSIPNIYKHDQSHCDTKIYCCGQPRNRNSPLERHRPKAKMEKWFLIQSHVREVNALFAQSHEDVERFSKSKQCVWVGLRCRPRLCVRWPMASPLCAFFLAFGSFHVQLALCATNFEKEETGGNKMWFNLMWFLTRNIIFNIYLALAITRIPSPSLSCSSSLHFVSFRYTQSEWETIHVERSSLVKMRNSLENEHHMPARNWIILYD